MSEIRIQDFIRTVPNYPVEGVNFYDMNSLFASEAWGLTVEQFCKKMDYGNMFGPLVTKIVGIESRGFVVGQALAGEMLKPFVMMRKKGAKYPGKLFEETYQLEYGEDTLVLQEGVLNHTDYVILADDLVATGGSVLAAKRLVEQTGAKVIGVATLINLKYLNTTEVERLPMVSMYEPLANRL